MSSAVPSESFPSSATKSGDTATASILLSTLRTLASLKIAVVLFAASIFIILVGTLAQVNMDMWEVMDRYFLAWVTSVELQVFFPRSWFPNLQDVPGRFPFPGGAAIGTGLVINLFAALLTRFKIQAKGKRLLIGVVAMIGAWIFTAGIITSGHNMSGIQEEPFLEWAVLWTIMKVGLAAATVGAVAVGTFAFGQNSRSIERFLTYAVAVIFGLLTFYLFSAGERAYLGDSGMRILWQLFLATLAGLAILAAALTLFKKRGAVVTIHLGIGLLMFGQYWVAKHDVEEQITVSEGQTARFARDIRQTELAIVDRSAPDRDEVLALPQSLLLASQARGRGSWLGGVGGRDSRLDDNGVIRDEALPFDVQVLEYYKNAQLVDVKEDDENLATAGTGLKLLAQPVRRNSGTDMGGQVDFAAAYVKLFDKSGEDLGVFLLSQVAASQDVPEKVSHEGDDYEVSLRFKRNYKPYTITLNDVRKDDYVGTAVPRNYSSDIRLVDQEKGIDRPIHIWMNNPLRFGGETFYQSGYSGPPDFPQESTTLSVVTNSGWMIPYVACMVVVVGLTFHFSANLLRFLNRRGREAVTKLPTSNSNDASRGRAEVWFPVGVVALFLLFLFNALRAPTANDGEMELHRFGALPIIADGRVKPFDTMARNNLRVISNRYSFRSRRSADDLKKRWPPITKKLLGRFSELTAAELAEREGDVDAVIELIAGKTVENRYRVEEYVDKLTTERSPAIRWLLDVIIRPEVAEQHKVFRIDNQDVLATLGLERRKSHLYSVGEIREGLGEFEEQVDRARETDVAELDTFQRKLLELDRRIRTYTRIAASFQIPNLPPIPTREDFEKAQSTSFAELQRFKQALDRFSQGIDSINPPLAVPPDAKDGEWESYAKAWTLADIERQLGASSPSPALAHLNSLLVAYRTEDVATFNREVAMYERLLQREPPEALKASNSLAGRFVKQRFGSFYAFEAYFNKVSPFFFCWWPYLAAFALSGFAWLGLSRTFNRAAFWLIVVTLLVHTLALVARIYLSGRPPVTNLYSSAVFIGWGVVVAGLALEYFYRNGVGNFVAAALGFASLVIAHNLAGDGDTFTVLQAVLDTQFWLALHVVIVTLGYAATFLAGFLGVTYVFLGYAPSIARLASAPLKLCRGLLGRIGITFRAREKADSTIHKDLARMIYGVVCFALLFSFFGTVLGGLWADDSWGRFWGWDPKENGALIIVLWNILVLHCRWDGIVKDRGMAVMAIGGNVVTGWSWYGVNELGVGLHSYGFTEGVLFALGIFVATQFAVIGLGMLPRRWWLTA